MKNLMIFIAALGVLFAVRIGAAQTTQSVDSSNRMQQERDYDQRMEAARQRMNRMNGIDERGMIADREDLLRPDPPRTKPDGKPYTRKELKQIEALKRPNEADLAKYADLLKSSKTGMFRLFPFLPCVKKNLLRVDGECAGYVADSWAYSFRTKNYSNAVHFDLKYKDGKLFAGGILSLGVLTALGDVPLENISLASGGLKFLAELKPEFEQAKSAKQLKEFMKGVDADGFKYSNQAEIAENTTYGLRVVAYRMPRKVRLILDSEWSVIPRGYNAPYPLGWLDERDDIVVAFRVIRREPDGNVTLVWKVLRREDAPELVFPKGVKRVNVVQGDD